MLISNSYICRIYWKLKKVCRFSVGAKVSLRPGCRHTSITVKMDNVSSLAFCPFLFLFSSSSLCCGCAELRFPVCYSFSLLTYTLITQTARNPRLAPLPHQLFCSLLDLCVRARVFLFVFVWLNIPVYTLERDLCSCVVMESHSLDLHARVRVVGAGEEALSGTP